MSTTWPESSPCDGITRVRFKGSSGISPRTSQPAGSPAFLITIIRSCLRVNIPSGGISSASKEKRPKLHTGFNRYAFYVSVAKTALPSGCARSQCRFWSLESPHQHLQWHGHASRPCYVLQPQVPISRHVSEQALHALGVDRQVHWTGAQEELLWQQATGWFD